MTMSRRRFLRTGMATFGLPFVAQAVQASAAAFDIGYLEGLAGNLHPSQPYLPPSALHPAYSHAFYVNTSFHGDARQKMWILARSGTGWDLALRDDGYWQARDAAASYSFPVSTGALHAGNPRAGPTPSGVFNVDERSARHRTGWGSPGMYRAVYIDLHYSGGRISGVAMHGTTQSRYNRLGQPDSAGCVRVTVPNMDAVWSILHPGGARGPESPLWGEVPRYFRSAPADSLTARTGYVRDGSLLRDDAGALLTKAGYRAVFVFFRDDL